MTLPQVATQNVPMPEEESSAGHAEGAPYPLAPPCLGWCISLGLKSAERARSSTCSFEELAESRQADMDSNEKIKQREETIVLSCSSEWATHLLRSRIEDAFYATTFGERDEIMDPCDVRRRSASVMDEVTNESFNGTHITADEYNQIVKKWRKMQHHSLQNNKQFALPVESAAKKVAYKFLSGQEGLGWSNSTSNIVVETSTLPCIELCYLCPLLFKVLRGLFHG